MIRSFGELTAEEQPHAGGKGSVLARLYQWGFPVPDGFVILPPAFEDDQLRPEAWAQARVQLRRLRGALPGTTFAVRSSALTEDSAEASFAGEFETVLDVDTDEKIVEAIQTVRRSRHSERVGSYSQAKGVDAVHDMAVVVQRLVPSEMAGVLFTADPVSGSHLHMTGNFVYGLGESLVSGKTNALTFTMKRPHGQYQGPPALKPFAGKLYKLASRLERKLGCPQDIEWAVAGGKLLILQSRPITTMIGYRPASGEWNDTLTGDCLWSNVNFGEAVTEAMTPLAWTVLQFSLKDWVFLPGYATVGNIGGCPYLNISVFASLFHGLGRSRQDLLNLMEGTLYMRLPQGMEIPLIPVSRWNLVAALPNLVRLQLRQKQGVRSLPTYLATNPEWCRWMSERIRTETSQTRLMSLWQEEIAPHLLRGVWTVLGTAGQATDHAVPLRRELTTLVGPEDAHLLLANVSDESRILPSLGPLVGLAKVAQGEMERTDYVELYGHRGPHEFEISVPRPAEDPSWLDRQLAQFCESPVDVQALLAQQRKRFDAAWLRFSSRYPHNAKAMHRRIAESARRARLREEVRSEYVRDRWLVRTFALRAGELTGVGEDIFFLTLDEVLDLLSGHVKAIQTIPARRATYERYRALPPYPSIIRGRFDPLQWAADPYRRSDIFDSHVSPAVSSAEEDAANTLLGSPGAAGRAEGTVRRLDNPEVGKDLQRGEVLVAVQTDIAWTLLFPRAAAIVTDVGAPLSHAAIVARELGIPAVVGCGDATMRLKTGDRVRVDGGRGVVEILKKA